VSLVGNTKGLFDLLLCQWLLIWRVFMWKQSSVEQPAGGMWLAEVMYAAQVIFQENL
jgi:hypothetical protein